MTAGLHHRWREMAVMLARVGPGASALDVCCGTGDFAFALRRAVGREGRVVGVDVSEEMLDSRPREVRPQPAVRGVPRGRRAGPPLPRRRVRTPLTTPAARPVGFDACTVGFGIRNVPDVARAFSEMRRVCRPGGKVVCLEITQPQHPGVQAVLPGCGSIAPCRCWAGWWPGDKAAYSYLPASVRRFPDSGGAEGADGGGRTQERPLRDPGRGHHRPTPRARVARSGGHPADRAPTTVVLDSRPCPPARVSIRLPSSNRR